MTTATATRPRRTISGKVATSHVRKNLIRKPKDNGKSEFSGLSLDDIESFTKDVSSYLAEVSKLSTSTIDRADFEELLTEARELEEWTPKRTTRKKTAKAKPLATEKKEKPVTVKVTVPLLTPTATLLRKAREETTEETPSKANKVVPGNWRYMAEHANTESARAWWTNWCERRTRGEV